MTDLKSLLREFAPQVVGALARRFRDFGASEDAVQEAMIAASEQWPRDGFPDNPRAWLTRVASRRLTDHVRAEAARRHREVLVVSLIPPEEQMALAPDDDGFEQRDETLDLFFVCCHPALTAPSAIALTLRVVAGLSTAEIAKAFLVPESTMGQRIGRAKQTIAENKVAYAVPAGEERRARLGNVMQVLYLIFNEGYAATSGDTVVRSDLSHEAIRLTRSLQAAIPNDTELEGLLALMLLTDARRHARTGPGGELIPLDRQDRSLWDRDAITEGVARIERLMPRGEVGPYQLQAAIAAVHDEAPSADATDWTDILGLYGVLEKMTGSPMVALNHAIAKAMVFGAEAGLEALEEAAKDPRLQGHHRVFAVRGHLLERAGRHEEAAIHLEKAAELTASRPERDYLLARSSQVRSQSKQ